MNKISAAYDKFFAQQEVPSLPVQAVIDLDRVLAQKEAHLGNMPRTPGNVAKGQQIHEARDGLRRVVSMAPLPPFVSKNSPELEVEATQHIAAPGSSSSQ